MSCVRIQTDATERVQCTALDASTDPLTGVTDLLIAIQRVSDGYWYDFNDDTFKNTGWTTRHAAMSEISATLAPGEYYYDFDTSAITNETANDTYMFYAVQSPGTTIANIPFTGEIKVGQYVDNLDQSLSDTESNIRGTDGDDLKDLSDQIDALPSTSDVKAQADQALIDYDPPTKAELDTAESNIRGADSDDLKSISDQIDALPTDSAADVADAVWDETASEHIGVGSFGEEVQSHATPTEVKAQADQALIDYDPPTKAELDTAESNIRGTDSDDLKTLSDQIDALPSASDIDTQLSGTHGAGSWQGDTAANIADAVWDEAKSGHVAAGSFGEEVQNHATPTEVKTQADQALVDYDPPTKAELDTAESNIRGSDSDDLKAISDQIDALPTPPSAADIDTELTANHGAGSWEGGSPSAVADAVWDEALGAHTIVATFGRLMQEIPTAEENADQVWDEQTSGHTDPGSFGKELEDKPTPAEIDVQMSSSHGGGSWTGTDPTLTADAVWDESRSGHTAVGSFGETVNELDGKLPSANIMGSSDQENHDQDIDAIKAKTDQLTFDGANVNAKVANKGVLNDPSAADIDTELTANHGAGSWQAATVSPGAIADAVWDEAKADHVAAGSFGEEVQTHATPSEVEATLSANHGAGDWEKETKEDIADQVWDEAKAGHTAVNSFGEEVQSHATPTEVKSQVDQSFIDYDPPTKAELDIAMNSIKGADGDDLKAISDQIDNLPSAVDIDTQLSAVHGSDSWEGEEAAAIIADAVWDEGKAAHGLAGSFGEEVQSHATPTEVKSQADQALSDYGTAKTSDVTTAESNIRGSDSDDLKDLSDQLDALAITANAINIRLPSDPADESNQQVSHAATQALIAAVQADVTSIKGTIENVVRVKQSFSYDASTDTFVANVWAERGNLVQTSSSNLTFTLYDEDGTQLFQETDSSPDTNGVFKISKATPGIVKNKAYYAIAQLTLGSAVSAGKGAFTVG